MKVLITGGLGYIGSHTCVALMNAGYEVALLDNLSNTNKVVLHQIGEITHKKPHYFEGDIRDSNSLQNIFNDFQPEAVIHFATLKSIQLATLQPSMFYLHNITGTLTLILAMQKAGVKKFMFSSTANVYGMSNSMPVTEASPTAPNNPYGRSSLMTEEIMHDVCASDPTLRVACLRYFNPVGAHPSGLIGENMLGLPSNLMPAIVQVAQGVRQKLSIFGNDYATPDGTAVRDFIHVMDLAESHIAALRYLSTRDNVKNNYLLANIGTGKGISVLEMVLAFQHYTGEKVPYEFLPRRKDDIAVSYADVDLAYHTMNWKARYNIEDMCKDTWRWQKMSLSSCQN